MKIAQRFHLKGLQYRWNMFLVNHMYAGTQTRHFEKKRKLLNALGHQIGEGSKIVGPIECTAKLIVGKNCWVGTNFTARGNGVVIIGDNCDIGPDVSFQTGGHNIGTAERRAGMGFNHRVVIGRGTWIGARSTFVNGVTVGESCVIAACACVNKDVDSHTLVGGVPAREIRRLV